MTNRNSDEQPAEFAVVAIGSHAQITVCLSEPLSPRTGGLHMEIETPLWELCCTFASLDEVRVLIRGIQASGTRSDRMELAAGVIGAIPLRIVCNDESVGRMALIASGGDAEWMLWRPDAQTAISLKEALYDLLRGLPDQT